MCLCVHSACARPLLARVCGVCVCVFGLNFVCAPPLLARVCRVGVCVWARVPAAPRHSRLGCWGVCVFVCVLRLYPASPGWGLQCGCVFLGSASGCAPPLLAGVLGSVYVCVCTPLVPRHSWLGCPVLVCVFGLGSQLRPATPGWGVGVCVCFPVCALRLVPCHSWLGCAAWVCVLGLGFRLRPATPGKGVWVCVCLCARSACTPRILAGLCDVVVCFWAQVSAATPTPGWGVLCALHLYPATSGWGVRRRCVSLRSGFGCGLPLLAGVLGCVCVCVRAPPLPRHSWLGSAAWLCVFWLGFRPRPATPGWGVGLCVCLWARPAFTPPLLAWVCGLVVCVWARVSAAASHSWLGCWAVCVSVCALRLVPCHSWLGRAVRVCVLGLQFRLRPPTHDWRVGRVCLFVCKLPLYPAIPGWGVWVRVCLCVCAPLSPRHSWLGCAVWVCVLGPGSHLRPLLAGVLGCVCLCARSPLVPRHSWLGCAAWVCVLGLGFRLRPATPGSGVGLCVRLCVRSFFTLPLLAGVCGVGVCA